VRLRTRIKGISEEKSVGYVGKVVDSGVGDRENGVNGYGRGFCLGEFDLVDE
jgi:hypothetical protein